MNEPSYWAVVPAPVRYDTAIPANAKLLYAELSSLANKEGFCFPGNAYLAECFSLTDTSIRRLLKALSDRGYIRVKVFRDERTQAVLSREIYVGINPAANAQTSAQKCAEVSRQKSADPSAQKCSAFNRKNNLNKSINNPPISPQGDKRADLVKVCQWNEERFLRFWDFYRTVFCASDHSRAGERGAAAKSWDKLKPDDVTIGKLGAKLEAIMQTRQWQDGIGIMMASTLINRVRRGEISLDDLPTPSAPRRSVAPEPLREEDQWL